MVKSTNSLNKGRAARASDSFRARRDERGESHLIERAMRAETYA